jgi:diguanylate cyclase (GGDEF)-like protein
VGRIVGSPVPRAGLRRALGPGAAFLLALLMGARADAAHSVVRHYSNQDGLPQLQVLAIGQDRAGYLWVGTQTGGVGRYNGHHWLVFDATNGLPGGTLYALAVGPDGTVYAGTGAGAARFDGGRWTPIASVPGEPSLAVHAIVAREGGAVWLGPPKGLRLAKPEGGGKPLGVRATAEIADAAVNCLVPGPDGTLWVGTGKGLGKVAPAGEPLLEPVPGLPAKGIEAVLPRPGGRLLVSVAETGLFEGTPGSFTRVGDDRVPGRQVSALQAEANGAGAVWIGTHDRGAFRWEGAFEPFGPGQGLKDLSINAIFRDREGLLWFGTDAGLWKRAPAAFVTWDETEGIPEGSAVFSMTEDRQGSLWLVLAERGLLRIRPDGSHRLFSQQEFESSRPNDTVVDDDGSLLVAAERGLFRVAGDSVRRVALPGEPPKGMRSVLKLRSGGLAFGTQNRGLYLLEGGRLSRLGAPVGLKVNALFETADGVLWTGGEGWGAAAFKNGALLRTLSMKEGLPSNLVNGILVDGSGVLWIATDRGAFREEPSGERSVLDRSNGLPDSFVYWVGEDRERSRWLGTNRGVARLKPDGSIRVYTSRQGLGADECNEEGFLVDSRGRVLVGNAGVSLFLGERRAAVGGPPVAVIEEVLAGGRPIPRFGEAPLAAGVGGLTFRFAGLSFADEGAVRFRYRLGGLSPDWTSSGPSQYEVTYGALPAGKYTFEVAAVAADGRVSAAPARVDFAMRPRWWQSNEFAAVCLVAAAALAWAAVHFKERRLERARLQLEKEVAERTEELRVANARLADLAVRDDLTGLANRRRILERLSEGIALARRQQTPLSVGLADLDYFKEVNDQLGHAEGDRYLREAAKAMKESLRDVDDLGRYGGDEFLVLLPGSDGPGAVAAFERLREAVGTLERHPGTPHRGSLSVGLATLDDGVRDGADLIHRADLALYEAKRLGRNRVVAWRDA